MERGTARLVLDHSPDFNTMFKELQQSSHRQTAYERA
jgi:hypothetical protein